MTTDAHESPPPGYEIEYVGGRHGWSVRDATGRERSFGWTSAADAVARAWADYHRSKPRSVLVTGSAGFVGSHMAAELFAQASSCDVAGPSPLDCLDIFRSGAHVYDLVVHCAARAPHRAAIDGQPAAGVYNRLLDAAMFEWAVRTGQRRVLYLSSSAVYPASMQRSAGGRLHEDDTFAGGWDGSDLTPFDAYGWAKLAGEQMAEQARAAGVPVTVVRPFSGYGEGQSELFPFGAFVARAKRREDPFRVWGDGSQVRDWIHVNDLVRGALAAVDADAHEPVNLCTGVGTSMANLAEMVCRQAGYTPTFEFDLLAPAGVAYRVGDPARMRKIYTSRVSLADGVARALAAAGV